MTVILAEKPVGPRDDVVTILQVGYDHFLSFAHTEDHRLIHLIQFDREDIRGIFGEMDLKFDQSDLPLLDSEVEE